MKKQKLKNSLKLGILTLGFSLLLTNCNKNDDITPQEIQQEREMTEISFDEFKSNSNLNNQFQSLNKSFNENKLTSKNNSNKKNSDNFDNAILLTDNIIKIKKEGFTTYTFTILTQTENDAFYNLVLFVNDSQEIYKSHILKYTPSKTWLSDTTQQFVGNVKIIDNDIFNVDNLLQSKSSHSAKSTILDACIDVSVTYVCSFGFNHAPGTCNASSYTQYYNFDSVPCGAGSDDDGENINSYNSENTGNGGGGDGSIVTAPNTVPYTTKLKNFESGKLNNDERNFYHSDINIKNTVDRYLIQNNFSNVSQTDTKTTLNFGHKLNLNFQQFLWVFNNRGSEELADINNYLSEIITITPEIKGFIKKVIDSQIETENNADVDFEDQIINNLTGKALCIYNKLISSSTGFKNAIKKFDGEFPVSHLSFKINNTLPSGNYGITNPPDNFNTTVEFSNTQLSNISDLGGAVAFAHEIIHAEIFRKMLSAAKKGDLDPANMTQQEQVTYVNSLRNNFPGIYDYYIVRYKPSWNHNQMASHYRNTIADIIEEFDNFDKSRQIYEDLSWVGLRILENGVISTAWDGLPQSEKDRVIKNFGTYFTKGTSNCN